jgi:hypothetical protein
MDKFYDINDLTEAYEDKVTNIFTVLFISAMVLGFSYCWVLPIYGVAT